MKIKLFILIVACLVLQGQSLEMGIGMDGVMEMPLSSGNTPMIQTVFPTAMTVNTLQMDDIVDLKQITVQTSNVRGMDMKVIGRLSIEADVSRMKMVDAGSLEANATTMRLSDAAPMESDHLQVTTPADSLIQAKEVLAEFLRLANQDVVLHMERQNMEILKEWLNAYKSVSPLKPAPILKPGIRMIAELRSDSFAEDNLRYYAAQGYNRVLITINSDDDSPERLVYLAKLVRKHGMIPWLAWGGRDSYNVGLYRSLETIRRQFKAVLPFCEGFIPAWRRTSVHTFQHDVRYLTVLCSIAQSINPELIILDEVFRRNGQTHLNQIQGASGTYISGYGFQTYHPRETAHLFFHETLTNRTCIALVVGHSGQYASKRDRHLTWNQAFDAKKDVEQQFLDAGCIGTITLHGDGYDIGTSVQNTDDIGMFPIIP